ncbi:hypothetical protein RINTHM_6180 [Richelia intracellularis HM01]|nr:hypothetical protein RINTHM_6180 [Richelia intracellularis HM01]
MACTNVVFPAPFGPTIATLVLGNNLKEISLKIKYLPRDTFKQSTSKIGLGVLVISIFQVTKIHNKNIEE